MKPLRRLAVAAVMVIAVLPFEGATAHAAPSQYLARSHVATWNIWGGAGNAYNGVNSLVAPFGGSNTVQSRIMARWPHMAGLGLQEVCQAQYNAIRFELYLSGYWLGGSTGGSGGYTDKYVMGIASAVGTPAPHVSCGDWFGSAVYVRAASSGTGGRFTAQMPPGSNRPTKYNYVCLWSLLAVCSAHLAPHSVQSSQSSDLKNVGNFLAVYTGLRTFVVGDFNAQPGLLTLSWVGDGWRDADQHSGGMKATTHSGTVIDYVWSLNPSTWFTDAWVPTSSLSLSDHYWKQGYF